jgi:chromosome segregation ATPase
MASEIMDKIQLLELRTKKAVTLINLLRSNNKELQSENDTIKSEKDDLQDEFNAFKETAADSSELDEVKRQLEELKAEHAKVKMDYTFANNRIIELQSYVDDYKDNTKLLEDSINKSIDTLDAIEGLDEIDLMEAQNTELEAADGFTSGEALAGDDLSDLDDLGDDLILEGDDPDLDGLDELEDLDNSDPLK